MAIKVAPFTVNPAYVYGEPPARGEEHTGIKNPPITYWGIYLDDEFISFVSSEDLAEKTKVWMERWLKTDRGWGNMRSMSANSCSKTG